MEGGARTAADATKRAEGAAQQQRQTEEVRCGVVRRGGREVEEGRAWCVCVCVKELLQASQGLWGERRVQDL